MTEAVENQELGWTPSKFEDDTSGLDRGDNVGLAETEEVQEAVAEEQTEDVTEAVEEVSAEDTVEEVEETEEVAEETTEDEPEAAESDDVVAEDPEPEQDQKKKQHMIPKDRLDQELAKRRQLENKLKELEEKAADKPEQTVNFDFDDAETKYMEAVLDGETEKAKQIRAEIRTMERQQMQIELQQSMAKTSEQTQAQIRLEAAVKEVTAAHPYLDLNSPDANQDLINETNELMSGFLNAGYDAVDALNKAVGYTTQSMGINAPVQEEAVIPNSVDKKVVADKVAKKTADSAAKKAQAANQQPPKLSGESQRSRDDNVVDIFSMSDKELNALSDEQLRKLRGDFG